MHRLFVAIRPPRAMREELLARMGGIAGARWQSDDQLHLTLRFIGVVERPMAEDIAATLGVVHHPCFSLALCGSGRFDRRGRIESLWAGVTPHAAVAALHRKIDQRLIRLGLPPEGRAYLPHITLARFTRADTPVDLPALDDWRHEPRLIEGFCLYESTLTAGGVHYEIIARYPLDAV